MTNRSRKCAAYWLPAFAFIVLAATPVLSADPATQGAESVSMFPAIDAGTLHVRLVVKNRTQARIVVRNNTTKPLRIRIPDAFAAVPAMARHQSGGGGGGGHYINVAPEKVAKQDVGFLCLEHGTPDPRSTMQYEIKPVDSVTTDGRVIEVLKQFGSGYYSHAAAQAAVWHLANGLSWRDLASKRQRNRRYFTTVQLQQAENIVSHVTK